jgi:zinc and cadmium transporter
MDAVPWLALYCGLIFVGSMLGGYVPLLGQITHSRLQFYLTASAGIMLGASFFHVMPDAFEKCGSPMFGWWTAAAVVGMFCIERFIAPHSHEIDGGGDHNSGQPTCDHHHHDHGHDHDEPGVHLTPGGHKDHRAAAPSVAGWTAVLGLTLHTFMNGFGLAGAIEADLGGRVESLQRLGASAWPGLAMFLAIVCHKPADALAISTVLARKGVTRRKITLVQFGFALVVPVGAAAFLMTRYAIRQGVATPDVESAIDQLTGAALAFSAGTFLFIALSDLLPEVQFHRHDRLLLFLTLVLGVALMGGIAYLERAGVGKEQEHGERRGVSPPWANTHGGLTPRPSADSFVS